MLEHHKVEQIQSGTPVTVITSKGVLNALQVVITAGVCLLAVILCMLCVIVCMYACWKRPMIRC